MDLLENDSVQAAAPAACSAMEAAEALQRFKITPSVF